MFFLFWSLRKQVKVHCHLSLLMGGENSAPFCGMCCYLSTALEGPWVGVHLSPCLAEKKAVRKVLAHSPCAIAQAEKCPHEGQARSSFLPLLFSPFAWWRAFGLAIPFGLPSPTLQSFLLTYASVTVVRLDRYGWYWKRKCWLTGFVILAFFYCYLNSAGCQEIAHFTWSLSRTKIEILYIW